MNEQLQLFARETLKNDLSRLAESHRLMFKRMYSHNDLGKDINQVVDDMPEDKLDWAMLQVQRSLAAQANKFIS